MALDPRPLEAFPPSSRLTREWRLLDCQAESISGCWKKLSGSTGLLKVEGGGGKWHLLPEDPVT